jgi:DNA-binding GntR family transcriptional regulator
MNSEFQIQKMLMHPVETIPALIDQIYERLLAAISDCSLRPGERIRQAELAARLGVSRQPVSHALQLLKRQGLVQETGRQGLEVTPIDPRRIRQLYEIRTALDGLAARLAAQQIAARHIPSKDWHAAEAAVASGRALTSAATVSELVRADVDFHKSIYRLSGNSAIEETVAAQWPHLMRSMALVLEEPDLRARAWVEHEEILRLVLAGDADGAERAARSHTDRAGSDIEHRLKMRVYAA